MPKEIYSQSARMKIQFRTVAIGSFVVSYFLLFGIFLLLFFLLDFRINPLFILIFPIGLYFLFRGKVQLEVSGAKLKITWIKKPIFHLLQEIEVPLAEVIRWKYRFASRGPDFFIIILKNGKKLRLRPEFLTFRSLHTELGEKFSEVMAEYHASTPKEELQKLIENSGYIGKIDRQLRFLKRANYFSIAAALMFLLTLTFTEENLQNGLSVLFLFFFLLSIGIMIYYEILKFEKKETLEFNE